MKRKLLDIELDDDTNKYRFYLEHSTADNKIYCLHFNFQTLEKAKEIFEHMRNEWKLPVSLVENRVIVFPCKTRVETGIDSFVILRFAICTNIETLGINFLNDEHADDFLKFANAFNGNGLRVNSSIRNNKFHVFFHKNHLIIPKYSLEKRVTINNKRYDDLSWFFSLYQALNNPGFPRDILFFITRLIIDIDVPDRYSELNEEFLLAKQSVDIKSFKKTICKISCDYDPYGIYNPRVYLTCGNGEDADILFKQLQFYTSLFITLNENEIVISPRSQGKSDACICVCYGTVFNRDEHHVDLFFKNDNEADMFLSLVEPDNLTIKPELKRNQVIFEANTLPVYECPYQSQLTQEFSFGGGM